MSCDNIKNLYKDVKKKKTVKKIKQEYLICLICGQQGCHEISVTNYTNYLNSSGTQLAKFFIKVIGEEPCYSISQLICEQCFLLIDRLDTYQSRAAEISNYISQRYKETKFEFLGNRQRISELIVSSLSNIKSFKNGTTLNVCDELSVTVFRESLQKGEPRNQTSTSASNLLKTSNSSSSFKNNNNNNNNNNNENNCAKLKRKRTSSNSQNNLIKKQKWTSLSSTNNNNNNNNNGNLVDDNSNYCNGLGSESSQLNSVHKNGDISESEIERSDKEDNVGSDSGSDNSQSTTSKKKNCGNSKSSRSSSNHTNSSSSSSSSSNSSSSTSSSSDSDNSSSSDDKSDDELRKEANRMNSNNKNSEQESKEKKPSKKIELPCRAKKEIKVEKDDMPSLEQADVIGNNNETEETMESHFAEAVLAQSSLASNLLESFMSTSLWMNSSSDSSNQAPFSNRNKQRQQQQQKRIQALQASANDDLTMESLNSAAAVSINDKKKRLELKNTGQSYINTKGKLIEAKCVRPQDCSRCPLRCNGRLSEEARFSIFSDYWKLGDYDLQREYMATHMEREERIGPSGLTRTVVLYFLTCGNERHQVCRQFFLRTLDVSEKASRIVLEKKLKGELGVEAPQLSVGGSEDINNSDTT